MELAGTGNIERFLRERLDEAITGLTTTNLKSTMDKMGFAGKALTNVTSSNLEAFRLSAEKIIAQIAAQQEKK